MKTKKGILMTEGLKMILSVICIVLLLILAFKLFTFFTKRSEKAQAQATLEEINAKIENLQVGDKVEYIIKGPRKWYMFFYNKEDVRPFSCGESACICMCPDLIANINSNAQACNDKGYCLKRDISFLAEECILDIEQQDQLPMQIIYDINPYEGPQQNDPKNCFYNPGISNLVTSKVGDKLRISTYYSVSAQAYLEELLNFEPGAYKFEKYLLDSLNGEGILNSNDIENFASLFLNRQNKAAFFVVLDVTNFVPSLGIFFDNQRTFKRDIYDIAPYVRLKSPPWALIRSDNFKKSYIRTIIPSEVSTAFSDVLGMAYKDYEVKGKIYEVRLYVEK